MESEAGAPEKLSIREMVGLAVRGNGRERLPARLRLLGRLLILRVGLTWLERRERRLDRWRVKRIRAIWRLCRPLDIRAPQRPGGAAACGAFRLPLVTRREEVRLKHRTAWRLRSPRIGATE